MRAHDLIFNALLLFHRHFFRTWIAEDSLGPRQSKDYTELPCYSETSLAIRFLVHRDLLRPSSAPPMPPRTLPPELGLPVIDYLGSEENEYRPYSLTAQGHVHALRQCALVCKDWLHRSRLNLYRTIYVVDRRAWRAVRATLAQHPELRAVVRVLRVFYTRDLPFWDVVLFMRAMLAPHLCRFHLYCGSLALSLDNVTRSCLQMRFHAVSTLTLDEMQAGQAVYILRAFPALRGLQCMNIDISDTRQSSRISQQISRLTPRPQLTQLKVCMSTTQRTGLMLAFRSLGVMPHSSYIRVYCSEKQSRSSP